MAIPSLRNSHPSLVLMAALAVVIAMTVAGPTSAQPGTGEPDLPSGVTWTALGSTWSPAAGGGHDLALARVEIQPGAGIPDHTHAGDRVTWVQQGVLEVRIDDGSFGPDLDDVARVEGVPFTLHPGEWLTSYADTVQAWDNPGGTPVVLLVASLLRDGDHPFDLLADRPAATPRGPARLRRVLRGHVGDQAYRITVRDRSGHLRDARMPSSGELRFGFRGEPPELVVGSGAGRQQPVLVRWLGTICGPVVTIDVDADLSRIRVIDRSPGCDAAGVPHAVVLVFDGKADLDDAIVTWEAARD
jgi:quercetin dioxygenase-like cupin family protein